MSGRGNGGRTMPRDLPPRSRPRRPPHVPAADDAAGPPAGRAAGVEAAGRTVGGGRLVGGARPNPRARRRPTIPTAFPPSSRRGAPDEASDEVGTAGAFPSPRRRSCAKARDPRSAALSNLSREGAFAMRPGTRALPAG